MNILDQFRKRVVTDTEAEVLQILERGKQLLDSHFYERSMIEFSRAMQLNRKLASETVTGIYHEMQGSGDLSGLISVGSSILSMDPKNTELANTIGNMCRRNGDWNQALSLYEHCLKIDPKHVFASYNLAATIARLEIADEAAVHAIAPFESMETFKLPDYHQHLPELWDLHHQMLPPEEEEEEEDEDEDDYTPPPTREEAEVQEDDFDFEPEEIQWGELLDFVLAHTAEDPARQRRVLMTMGLCCLERKIPVTARRVLDQLSYQEPKNLTLRCCWLLTLAIEGKPQEAISKLVLLLGKYPNHRYANLNLGILYRQANKPMSARRHFFITYKLLLRSQGHYEIEDCLRIGHEFHEKQSYKKALAIYEPLIPEISDIDLLNRIGHLYLEQRNLDDAYKAFQRALRKDRKNAVARQELKAVREAYIQQAENDIRKGSWKEAAHKFEQVLAILPSISVIKELQEVYIKLEDRKRIRELDQKIQDLRDAEVERQQQHFLEIAIQAESVPDFKDAMNAYEEALRIRPRRDVFLRMISLCETMERTELVPQLTAWFNEIEEEYQRQQEEEARPAEEDLKENENAGGKRKRRKKKAE
jgi:tetratricopeptide (TPR) repeat protein